MELMFNDRNFDVTERDGRTWLRLSQIGVALGYANPYKVQQVYERNAAEFSPEMTALIKLPDLQPQSEAAGQMREVRIFSLRGAHLLGMFARTKKACEFRKWALDRLDEIDRQAIPNRSLMAEWYKAKAAVDDQNRFASLCGKGLSEHKTVKPPLIGRLHQIGEKLQPSLCFN